ncbi:class I SAM-dependent methyltransferase [Nitrospira sp. Nam74]
MTQFRYVGSELETFARAINWKSYIGSQIRSYLLGDVLEVGAGIGATTRFLRGPGQSRWTCLEPDPALARALIRDAKLAQLECDVVLGSLQNLNPRLTFDSILYIDVLEHIEDDRAELVTAAAHLKPNGTLIVLAPAHQFLFSPFDRAVGHFRRYNKKSLQALMPQGLKVERHLYMDSIGAIASFGNRMLLKSGTPGTLQIRFWDGVLVPLSRVIDPLLRYSIGKSILAVWRRRQ